MIMCFPIMRRSPTMWPRYLIKCSLHPLRSVILFSWIICVLQAASEYIPEKVKKAEKKLEENPYDLDAWSILIREAQV